MLKLEMTIWHEREVVQNINNIMMSEKHGFHCIVVSDVCTCENTFGGLHVVPLWTSSHFLMGTFLLLMSAVFLTSVWRHGHSLANGWTRPVFVRRHVPLPVAFVSLLLQNDTTQSVSTNFSHLFSSAIKHFQVNSLHLNVWDSLNFTYAKMVVEQ